MSDLCICPIVEGHGEVLAVRTLLTRIWLEIVQGDYVDILRPIRIPRTKLAKPEELIRAVDLATLNLKRKPLAKQSLVLLLLDATGDLPCELGPRLFELVQQERHHVLFSCVVVKKEYETWFAAGAESLERFLDLTDFDPAAVEGERVGKGWIENRFLGVKYSETLDQVKLTSQLNLALCRSRSASFDKLCRELEKRRRPGLG